MSKIKRPIFYVSLEREAETEIYEKLCIGCPKEKQCHEDATVCEEFDKLLFDKSKIGDVDEQ